MLVGFQLVADNLPVRLVSVGHLGVVSVRSRRLLLAGGRGEYQHIAPMNTNTIAGSTILFCRFSRCASVSGSRSFFGFPVSGAALFSFVGSFFFCSR